MSASLSASIWPCSGSGRVPAPGVIAPTHVYYAEEGRRPPEPMRQEQFPWYRAADAGRPHGRHLLAGRAAGGGRRRPGDLPPVGIKSNLCIPLSVGGEPPVGALGFNTLRAERDWPDALVKRLQLVAQVFTNALARRRHELACGRARHAWRRPPTSPASGSTRWISANGVPSSTTGFATSAAFPQNGTQGLEPVEFWIEHLHPEDRQRVLEPRQQLHDGRLEQSLHRVSLPASDPRGEMDSSRGPRRQTRRQRTRGQDVRRPSRHHGATATRGGAAAVATRRSSG